MSTWQIEECVQDVHTTLVQLCELVGVQGTDLWPDNITG